MRSQRMETGRNSRGFRLRLAAAGIAGLLTSTPLAPAQAQTMNASHPAADSTTAAAAGLANSLGTPLSSAALEAENGRGVPAAGAPVNAGTVSGNISGAPGGPIAITGSFNNDAGFTTVLTNSGNNALIQSSTVVNITVN